MTSPSTAHDEGWVDWIYCAPAIGDCPVQVMRDGWDSPSLICRDDMHALMNVAGLYWRRTGIYREREAAMPRQAGQHANCMAAQDQNSYSSNWMQAILGGMVASEALGI